MSGLRNRLEEVIRRYERAETLVKSYKSGEIDDDLLGKEFRQLRKDRKKVDKENHAYIQSQRSAYLGSRAMDDEPDGDSVGSRDTEDGAESYDEDEDSYDEEEEDEEEDEDEDDDEDGEEEEDEGKEAENDGSNQEQGVEDAEAAPAMTRRERKLWKRYGSFWDSA